MKKLSIKNHAWTCATLAVILMSGPAHGTGVGVSLKIGTTGMGADVTAGFHDRLNARAGLNMLPLTFKPNTGSDNDVNVTVDIDLQTIPVTLDFHPFASNFRTSIGLALNNNAFSLSAEPGDSIELEDTDYIVDKLSAKLSFNRLSPYFGLGYGNAVMEGSRLAFAFDLGVLYHGSPKLRAKAVAAYPEMQEALDRDLRQEVDKVEEELDSFRFYPVLTFGLSFRF